MSDNLNNRDRLELQIDLMSQCTQLAAFLIERRVRNLEARPALTTQLAEAITAAVEDWFFDLDQDQALLANAGGSDAPPSGTPEPE